MKIPYIDKRSKNDLIEYIKEVAPYYAPKWRFDSNDLDMGSVLALIFTEMFYETIERINKVPYKNFLTFLNSINSNLYPSVSAKGYITFQIVDGINEGIMVGNGERLSAISEDGKRVFFETIKNLYVTVANIDDIFNVSFLKDSIIHSYERIDNKNLQNQIKLFGSSGENLQKHEFYIQHKNVLHILGQGKINIFIKMNNNVSNEEFLNKLTDPIIAKWEYIYEGESIALNKIKNSNESIEITKDFINENFKVKDNNVEKIGIIKCKINDISYFENLNINKIELSSESENILPDKVYSNDLEQGIEPFFPFGERFSAYNDINICCNEALNKSGANIKLNFQLEFKKVPIEIVAQENEINWKLIIKKSNFNKQKEYDISINEVIWEYWNGIGWAKLQLDSNYSKLFNNTLEFQKRNVIISFKCPNDMEETVVNSNKGLFIRIRVLRVENAYMINGNYISPIIDNIKFSYKYNTTVIPQKVYSTNNTVERVYDFKEIIDENKEIHLLEKIAIINNITYLGFEKKPLGGPIKILFSLSTFLSKDIPILTWEYYSNDGWKILTLIDETENMRKSGIVSFIGEEDLTQKVMFNKNRYWIRIYNLSKHYEDEHINLPVINGIYINTTPILQNDAQDDEFFDIKVYEKNKVCKLLSNNVNHIEVWINEYGKISEDEMNNMDSQNIDVIKNVTGEIETIWVKWEGVNDFIISSNNDRHYIVDKNNGLIYFGDGTNGKIPTYQEERSIKVKYSIGGGEHGNLDKNQITNMTRNLGYINTIFNPMAISGGCNMETISEAIERSPNILKHRGRAVTLSDYENIAKEASRNIAKVKCFSGINTEGEKEFGNITLVILQKGNLGDSLYFNGLKYEVMKYFKKRNINMLNKKEKFNVIAPQFVNISVKIDLYTQDLDYVFLVKQEIENRICEFINPMTGNFNKKGWEIGQLPEINQILNCLKDIKKIKKINNIIISASVNDKGIERDIDINNSKKKIYCLPINGKHKINVFVN